MNIYISFTFLQSSGGVRPSLAKRLGPAVPPANNVMPMASKPGRPDLDNCTLELKKIPPGLNTISHLNDHFAKFGTIVNIQVRVNRELIFDCDDFLHIQKGYDLIAYPTPI